MLEHGFEPDFPPEVAQQLAELKAHPPQVAPGKDIRDLRQLLWSSIDNDTSRDLDQIEVAERLSTGEIKVLVGIADVDAFVRQGSPIDEHAAKETTTVYAGVRNFPMLPEELSTGASSLLESGDKLGVVIEFVVGPDGGVSFERRLSCYCSQSGSAGLRFRRAPGSRTKGRLPRKWRHQPRCRPNSGCRTRRRKY